jgi:hypothetical protein
MLTKQLIKQSWLFLLALVFLKAKGVEKIYDKVLSIKYLIYWQMGTKNNSGMQVSAEKSISTDHPTISQRK